MDENPYGAPQTKGIGQCRFRFWIPIMVIAILSLAGFSAYVVIVAERAKNAMR